MNSATIQYRLNLPHALHTISPALSALHTSRAAALHPEISAVLHPSHCPKCGTYHFSGDHPSYLVGPSTRKKRKRVTSPHLKVLQRRCCLCGFSIDVRASSSLDRSSLPSDLSRTEAVPTNLGIQENDRGPVPPSDISSFTTETVKTIKSASVPPTPGRQSHPKFGHTKTSTLKDMLSRNRQREENVKSHKKKKESHEGLAAFLKEL